MGYWSPYCKKSIVHVTEHASGWLDFKPAHLGIEKYLFPKTRPEREIVKYLQITELQKVMNFTMPGYPGYTDEDQW